jgi:cytochrome c556
MKKLFATLLGASLISMLAACGAGGGDAAAVDDSPEGLAVQYRQSVMRSLGYKVAAVRAMATGEVPADEAKFRKDTADVAALAGMLPEGFIPSSSATESNANPEVWTNMADFQQKAADLKNAADALAATAASQGFEAAKGMVQAAGSTCGACHRPYRQRAQAEE